MANFYCTARTNYFAVKNEKKFLAWVAQREITAVRSQEQSSQFALFPGESDDGGAFPNYDCETDDEIDFVAELAGHLRKGSVAVIVEAGAEKLRYISAHATAVAADGRRVDMDLNEIYTRAVETLGAKKLSRAEY
ncbi:MAG: hypothetical protein ACOZE5_18310 [Verrucomicrobiota bacterium]